MSKSKLRHEESRLAIKEYQEGKGSYKTITQKSGTDYLSGKGNQQEICKKYKIRNRRQLRAWIKWYNGHQKFKEHSSAKGEIYMTK